MKSNKQTMDNLVEEIKKLIKTQKSRIIRLEKELKECLASLSENCMLNEMVSRSPISIQILDKDGYSISVNKTHTRFFGVECPPDYNMFSDPLLLSQELQGDFKMLKNGEAVFFKDTWYNTNLLNPAFPNKTVWVKTCAFPMLDSKGKPERFVIMHEDITQRIILENEVKEKNEQVQILTENIKLSIEKEKKTLSEDLHDNLLQDLAGTSLKIDALSMQSPTPEFKAKMEEIAAELRRLLIIGRDITTMLRPEIITIHGIETAIKLHAETFAEKNHLEVITQIDNDLGLPDKVSLQIFRILQEALTNITKHAKASKMEIHLNNRNDGFHFTISDNGKGFDTQKTLAKNSFGIIIMKDRVTSMGGTFTIKAKETQGTEISISLPKTIQKL